MDKDLKAKLKEAMEERGVKIPSFAKISGIPKDRIYAWYRDDTNPKGEDSDLILKWINEESFTQRSFKKNARIKHLDDLDVNTRYIKCLEEYNQLLKSDNKKLLDQIKDLKKRMKTRRPRAHNSN